MRLCDMGLLREANDASSGVDPNLLPPDYCFVLPSGLFTYEDPTALAGVWCDSSKLPLLPAAAVRT